MYGAMWARFVYGGESCDANGPRNVKTKPCETKAGPHLSLLLVLPFLGF